jgi:hypothetical protein
MNRLFSFRPFGLGVVFLGVLTFAAAAQAQTVPLKASGEGQVLFQIDPTEENPVGIQVFRASGVSTLLGTFTGGGITLFTADGDVLPGSMFTAVTPDGSTIVNTYSGSFAPVPGTADFMFVVDQEWGNGTGRLAGLSGENDLVAVLDGLTGAFTFEASGDWFLR